eukprot:3203656-Alexandrium_andersonii.AAC.1
MTPGRTVSSEGRIILDTCVPNLGGDKRNRPPALQPRRQQLARKAVWWRARRPGIPLVCAQRD